MTNLQKIRLRLSKVRARLNAISGLEGETFTDEIREEASALQAEYADLETRHQAAIVAEGEPETRATEPDAELRERLALRGRASLTAYLRARLQGRGVTGAEAELADAAGCGDGIPLELWDVPGREGDILERRDVTAAPGTVGVNLAPIAPAIFAPSIAPRLGIEMPRVESGTYASATISTSLTAAAKAKGADAVASAAGFTVTSATPKRISGRLSLTLEDIAAAGAANFEAALRENLSMVMSDALDNAIINGTGADGQVAGLFKQIPDPEIIAGLGPYTFDDFVSSFAAGIDGLWASRMKEVSILCGPETYRLSARTFRDAAAADLGSVSFADYAAENFGDWFTNARMPVAGAKKQEGILYRRGRAMRTAVCPHWNTIQIDDIYSGSASGTRHLTAHVLLGDVILVQPGAYAQHSFRVKV